MNPMKLLPAPIRRLLLPAPRKPRPTVKRIQVHVPEGFVLPEGNKVTQPFNLTVEAGVRWHPDWDEPRFTVNAFRFLPMGDALCWSGDSLLAAFGGLLPTEFVTIGATHGMATSIDDGSMSKLLDGMGLDVPTERQPWASFRAMPPHMIN